MDHLLAEIRAYCGRVGITVATFGSYALNDSGFVARIIAGGECLPRTEARVRAYMAANPERAVRRERGAA